MKKADVINLIKYHTEKNEMSFRNTAYLIAEDFDKSGDYQLAEYIMSLLSDVNTFYPQVEKNNLTFARKVKIDNEPLLLPDVIKNDILGIINACKYNINVRKFLFEGGPGTGKTETVKQIARLLGRELFVIDFNLLIDSKLGQTSKNIAELFEEINTLKDPSKVLILFDEIDALALDRTDSNDLREMGRATTAVLKGLDELNDNVLLIATTNLYKHFDKALIRRFDSIINFNRYTREDLIEISEIILSNYLSKFKSAGRNMRLFRKIIILMENIPYPGELKNMIKTSLAFSDPNSEFDYLKRLYLSITKNKQLTLKTLSEQGFTIREIEILTGISKSQVARDLKEKVDE